jgi:serine/threonine kinase 16
MISDDGSSPVLMDLGSIAESPLAITSRSLAIATQDTAAEHSTMPYRAPELFDVKTGTVIDTKVDIWSMGCTLYACLVGKSPFEMRSDETGGSLSLCVLGGDWRFPDEGPAAAAAAAGGKAKGSGKAAGAGDANGGATASPPGSAGAISEPIREVVRRCLKVEPSERPDIDELIALVEKVVDELPEDDTA